jgi:hypothetical protein
MFEVAVNVRRPRPDRLPPPSAPYASGCHQLTWRCRLCNEHLAFAL